MKIIFDSAKEDLNKDFYETFYKYVSAVEDCVKYLP